MGGEDDEEVEEEFGLPSDIANYTSWTSVALDAPPTEATKPTETGGAHGTGTRKPFISTHRVSKPSKMPARKAFRMGLQL